MGDNTSTKIPPFKGDRPVVQSEVLKKSQKVAKADDVVTTITGDFMIIFKKKFQFSNDLLIDILTTCGVSLSQLSYRAMSIIMRLIIFFRDCGVTLSLEYLSRMDRLISGM
ncbi:hypothetical protein IEQ34_011638 [Dendrobium chrysotoxum]|uniref:Uncharacterized protein n=1 Tax=Dendrobium chrysotoxum TaxID=161865 RepID=A0AAV7GTF5_DENCH|nr:hypothetical protein IEQ34_011638 [Dendrobium chrysotoxum]